MFKYLLVNKILLESQTLHDLPQIQRCLHQSKELIRESEDLRQ